MFLYQLPSILHPFTSNHVFPLLLTLNAFTINRSVQQHVSNYTQSTSEGDLLHFIPQILGTYTHSISVHFPTVSKHQEWIMSRKRGHPVSHQRFESDTPSTSQKLFSLSQLARPPLWCSGLSSWGPLVSTTEEVLKTGSGSGLETRDYSRRDPPRWPRDIPLPQTLTLT
jgi:hypothetical protein